MVGYQRSFHHLQLQHNVVSSLLRTHRTLEDVGPYYDDVNYVEHSDSNQGFIFKIYHQARKIMLNHKLRHDEKSLAPVRRLLDVGSGSGIFSESYAKGRLLECLGVEISENAREHWQNRSLT